jgi:hypothetical protein
LLIDDSTDKAYSSRHLTSSSCACASKTESPENAGHAAISGNNLGATPFTRFPVTFADSVHEESAPPSCRLSQSILQFGGSPLAILTSALQAVVF